MNKNITIDLAVTNSNQIRANVNIQNNLPTSTSHLRDRIMGRLQHRLSRADINSLEYQIIEADIYERQIETGILSRTQQTENTLNQMREQIRTREINDRETFASNRRDSVVPIREPIIDPIK